MQIRISSKMRQIWVPFRLHEPEPQRTKSSLWEKRSLRRANFAKIRLTLISKNQISAVRIRMKKTLSKLYWLATTLMKNWRAWTAILSWRWGTLSSWRIHLPPSHPTITSWQRPLLWSTFTSTLTRSHCLLHFTEGRLSEISRPIVSSSFKQTAKKSATHLT